jgi:hypothetical protein
VDTSDKSDECELPLNARAAARPRQRAAHAGRAQAGRQAAPRKGEEPPAASSAERLDEGDGEGGQGEGGHGEAGQQSKRRYTGKEDSHYAGEGSLGVSASPVELKR